MVGRAKKNHVVGGQDGGGGGKGINNNYNYSAGGHRPISSDNHLRK